MKATSREQAWEMANAIFPTDYEKDEGSSQRAGYDIYRHQSLNYFNCAHMTWLWQNGNLYQVYE